MWYSVKPYSESSPKRLMRCINYYLLTYLLTYLLKKRSSYTAKTVSGVQWSCWYFCCEFDVNWPVLSVDDMQPTKTMRWVIYSELSERSAPNVKDVVDPNATRHSKVGDAGAMAYSGRLGRCSDIDFDECRVPRRKAGCLSRAWPTGAITGAKPRHLRAIYRIHLAPSPPPRSRSSARHQGCCGCCREQCSSCRLYPTDIEWLTTADWASSNSRTTAVEHLIRLLSRWIEWACLLMGFINAGLV